MSYEGLTVMTEYEENEVTRECDQESEIVNENGVRKIVTIEWLSKMRNQERTYNTMKKAKAHARRKIKLKPLEEFLSSWKKKN
ncbi:hypothetical protein RCJ22_17980 [Vibrio sp. FNV 38]|nr:hypothetical protein [Vibrio sp. FNV 38]